MMQRNPILRQQHLLCMALACLVLGTLALGACYSALESAGDSSSQYADDANVVQGTAFVPLPEQTWTGLNLLPHDANTMCIDGVVATGTGVSLQTCSGAVLQRFKWYEGTLSVAGDRCLDLDTSNGVPEAGTAVMLKPCDANTTTQLWSYGNGWVYPEVVGRTSPPSICLSTVASSVDAGSALQLVACNQTPAPISWDMSLYDGNSWVGFAISSAINAGACLDANATTIASGAQVHTATCTGSASQGITMRGGALLLDGFCLDVTADAAADHTLIELHTCVAAAENELFAIEHGRIYTYSGPNVGRCVEVPGGVPAAGKQLDILTCSTASTLAAAANMHWVLGYDVR